MTGLVLLQQGLDVTLPLEPGENGRARHRGGGRLVVANPADRAALEWALAVADRVIAVTVGPSAAEDLLQMALARGASRAVRIWDESLPGLDAAAMARLMTAAVRACAPDLVLAGERGLEGTTGMLPALVAAHLGWPCVDGALQVAREPDGAVVQRRLDGGRREEVAAECPLVVTVTPDSVEPRYVSVRARRAARARPVEEWDPARLGLSRETVIGWVRASVERLDWPRPRPRRSPQPPKGASAAERMRQLMGGDARAASRTPRGEAAERLLMGEPGEVAGRILAFLQDRGFL